MFLKLLLSGILATTLAFAQRGGGGGGSGGGGIDMSAMQMGQVQSRLDRITNALKLTKDQKKEVKTTLDEAHKEAAPLRDQLVKSRLAIGQAIQDGKSQDEINQLINSHAVLESQMAGIELKAFAKIYKGLEKDQQTTVAPVFLMMKGIFSEKNWNTTE
jgi:hypothetical protein